MTDGEQVDGAVVPLDDARSGDLDPWQSLAGGSSLLVTWHEPSAVQGATWGPTLKATSGLAQQLATIASKSGGWAAQASEVLYRVEVPTGYTLQSLVPAVGGGFRGLVRSADGASIAGQARLVPVGGAAAGAGIALGPLVGLMALSVGAEMLARHQQEKKLAAIKSGVDALRVAADEQTTAQLQSVSQAMELGSAALLERVEIPPSIGLGAARNNLRDIKNRGVNWLAQWEQALSGRISDQSIHFDDLKSILARNDTGDHYTRFAREVATLYEALTLDSRALVVHAAEAAVQNPGETLSHFQAAIQRSLQENAELQDRLKSFLLSLSEIPVTSNWWRQRAETDRAVEDVDRSIRRLASSFAQLPDAPPLLTQSNRQVLEIRKARDGQLSILAPRATA